MEQRSEQLSRAFWVDLSGTLARIRLPTVCLLLRAERLSGILVVERGHETVSLYLCDGQLVDVEPLGNEESPRARLAELCAWTSGSFCFVARPIDRPTRMAGSTLFFDHACSAYEAEREARTEGF